MVAVDPQNANTVYAAVGGYTNSWDPNNPDTTVGGVWHSTNGGTSFTKLTNVALADGIGFGMAANGQPHPAIYLEGKLALCAPSTDQSGR